MLKEPLGITFAVPAGQEATGVYEVGGGVEVFETDTPYLLSDGTSLMPPLPVILTDGPIFTDKMGNVQTALGVTGIEPPGPQPLAVSDFANGIYEIGGSAVAVEDMWDGSMLSDWDPETDITAGVGQTSGSAELKATVIDPPDTAFTVVFDWDLAAGSYVEMARVDWATFDLQRFRALESTATLEITDGTASDSESVSSGGHRTAATFSSGLLAASTDGGSPLSIATTGGPYTGLAASPGSGSSISKITFYPAQDTADLPALSAL